MTEFDARTSQTCPACGAKATWNPGRQALVCGFCGTEAPGELDADTGKVREIPLAATLRALPDELRGWQSERRSVRCQSCRAISVFDAERVGQNCTFCGSPSLVPYEEIQSPIRPQSVLPFTVTESDVREAMRAWYASKWLAPGALRKKAALDTIRGVYLPYWTFDASVRANWSAESGTYYYTTETVRGSDGRPQTRQVRHVRWQPASGQVEHFFDDEPIPGSTGVHPGLLGRVGPFPAAGLVPYDTAYLSGFVVEHYQVVLIDAARSARESMDRQLRDLCAASVPGDTHRNLRVDAEYAGETFKHILVPVWLLAYRFRGRDHQVVVNGHTGRIAGEYPRSAWKVAALVLVGIAVLAVVAWLASQTS
jgi:hypothetical protein